MTVLQPLQWVLIEQPNGFERLVHLKPGTILELGRYGKVKIDEIIGKTSGLYFEINTGGKLCPISPDDVSPEAMKSAADEEAVEMSTNQEIFDDNSSQKLSIEEIEKMKAMYAQGNVSASSIVENIVEGNENFEKKNAYSKEKYIKRKQQKFLKWICPRLPTTRLLADHFTRRDPSRIIDLRIDTLSQLLGHANLFEGGKYLLWDDSFGFVTGAILSRLSSPSSMLVSLFTGNNLQHPFLPNFNLDESQKSHLYPYKVDDVGPGPLDMKDYHENPNSLNNPEAMERHKARFEERQKRRTSARKLFDNRQFTSLILVCNEQDPTVLMDKFGPFLAPSGRLIVFCKWKEPLMAAFIQARWAEQPAYVDVCLTESWLRPYQTAAGRLHPEMSLASSGAGYLLTATRVLER